MEMLVSSFGYHVGFGLVYDVVLLVIFVNDCCCEFHVLSK